MARQDEYSSDFKKAIDLVKRDLGNEAVQLLDNNEPIINSGVSTGLCGIDEILGTRGIVFGRIYELFGPEAHGKTSLALTIIASFQRQKKICAYIDVENALEPEYCGVIGVDCRKLILAQPSSCEQTWKLIESIIKTKQVNLIIVDSVAALSPEAELIGDISDNSIGLLARVMSKGLRKINGLLAKSNCSIIFINQLRSTINYYGSGETTPGGRALKFYSSVRMEVRRTESIYSHGQIIGSKIRIKILKNKLFVPFQYKIFNFIYGKGFDYKADLIEQAITQKMIVQRGPYYYFENQKIAQGKIKLFEYLDLHPEIMSKIISPR